MINWSKTDSINLILIAVVIVGLLSGGIVSMFWAYPNDQGSINNAALQGEEIWANPGNITCCYQGGRTIGEGPAVVSVGPRSEARYIVEFNQTSLSSLSCQYALCSTAGGLTYVLPALWTSPSTAFSSFERRYAVFTYSFPGLIGPQGDAEVWFTGPQGNLSQTVHTAKYGGTDVFHSGLYGTSIIEASSPGNYTLHFVNPAPIGSGTLNGTVVMGPSSVTFARPYVYAGAIAILVGVTVAVVTSLILVRKFRKAKVVRTTKPSYMSLEK